MEKIKGRALIFTDLDGTLLDHETYSFAPAKPALTALARLNHPVILTSSKTKSEMLQLQEEMGLSSPFVVENGGGFYVTQGYFEGKVSTRWEAVRLGADLAQLSNFLRPLRDQYDFITFSDARIQQVVEWTGLSFEKAALAKERDFSEPLMWNDTEKKLDLFKCQVEAAGFRLIKGGRFWHLIGQSDKAIALQALLTRYQGLWPGELITTVALGDSPNDLLMLQTADVAVAIQPITGRRLDLSAHSRSINPQALGPLGWCQAMEELFEIK